MFMFYAVVAGILVGLALGGRLDRLGAFHLHWLPLAVAGLIAQLLLFSPVLGQVVGATGPGLYVLSTAAVLLVVLRNVAIPGLAIVAAGATSNLIAIIVNGGFMPASPTALSSVGLSFDGTYSNSAVVAAPVLRPLTDIFAMPAWLPLANIFSIGDVVIGIGVAVAIVTQMRAAPASDAHASSALVSNAPTSDTRAVPVGTSLHRADPVVPRGH